MAFELGLAFDALACWTFGDNILAGPAARSLGLRLRVGG